jgi:diaminopimelate epimerase
MQRIPFTKMHGLGNDFVILDRITHPEIEMTEALARELGHRQFWVGCDQILIIERSEIEDFKYRIYNQDGSEVEMCGNGARCFLQYVRDRGLTEKHEVRVEIAKWIIILRTDGKNIMVDMGAPITWDDLIPVKSWVRDITVEWRSFSFTPISMGNPHAVIIIDEPVSNFSVQKYGRPIEVCIDIFPKKVNVEFINITSRTSVDMRVWERGTWETLACGTGACAAVVAGILADKLERNISIRVSLRWGDLYISWSGRADESVMMSGPATTVFDGEFFL